VWLARGLFSANLNQATESTTDGETLWRNPPGWLHTPDGALTFSVTNTLTAPVPDTATPPPRAWEPEPNAGYFEQPGPIRLILGSFFGLTIPIGVLVCLLPGNAALSWLYVWLFGGTHIVLTLSVYGSRANRAYFTKTPKAFLTFVGVPLVLLGLSVAMFAFQLGSALPWLAVVFFGALRAFNFFHLTRQTFGVLQLVKARQKLPQPAWGKKAENASGLFLVLALMLTHAAGGWCPWLMPECSTLMTFGWTASVMIALALFGLTLSYLGSEARWYFTLQTLGTLAATVYLPLYLASLAMHYVEYHVLMVPRIRHQQLDESSRVDRAYGWMRSRPLLFIGALLGLSALVTSGMSAMTFEQPAGATYAWGMILTAFDALVVVHYFLEMHLWKFSDPHIRKSLDGVYFAKKAKASA
jgi:hypothetical protein